MPIQNLLDYLESGAPLEEFVVGFPPITRDQAIKVLELARTGLFDSCREVKILIDHNLDWRISDQLSGHEVRTALEMAWDTLKNALLTEAEKVRVLRINHLRQGIKDQQTMKGRSIAVVVIRAPNNRLETHVTMISQIAQIVTVVSSHRGISLRDEASARGYRRSVDIVFDYRYKSRSIYESCNNR